MAAKKLGLARITIIKLIEAKLLPATRIGDALNSPYLIDENDLKLVEVRKRGNPNFLKKEKK